jgi:hypothetical protein
MNRIATAASLASLLSIFTAGCAHDLNSSRAMTLKGELTSGAECPMIVTSDGRRYSLTGSLAPFKIGDRVCLRGRAVEASICMAGEATIAVDAIGPEDRCP